MKKYHSLLQINGMYIGIRTKELNQEYVETKESYKSIILLSINDFRKC